MLVTEEVWRKFFKYIELNENESTKYENLWDTNEAVLMWKFIALNHIRKE